MTATHEMTTSVPCEWQGLQLRRCWEYRDRDGRTVGIVARYDADDGQKQVIPFFKEDGEGFVAGGPQLPSPLYGVDRLDRASTERVLVVEGEKCAAALHSLGMPAVTSQGGSGAAGKADWSALAGTARVVILPDADTAGEKYAMAVASKLAQLDPAPELHIARLPGLSEGGDVVDWLQARLSDWDGYEPIVSQDREQLARDLHANIEEHAEAFAGKAEVVDDWPREAIPLRREPDPPQDFPIDALGIPLAPAVKRIAEVVCVDPAVPAQSALAATSLAAQPHRNVVVDGRVTPLSLYCITVAESGDRKTAVDRVVMASHNSYQQALQDTYNEKNENYKRAKDAYDAAYKKTVQKRKGVSWEDTAEELARLGAAPEPPLMPLLLAPDPTFEGLVKVMAIGQPSMGLFNDDGGNFIYGSAFSDDHAVKTASGLSRLWDGADVSRVRSIDGSTIIRNKRLAMHLMVQPSVAPKLIGNPALRGQGFTARFLVVWPQPYGKRTYQDVDLTRDPAVRAMHDAFLRLLNTPLPLRVNPKTDREVPGELDPGELHLSSEAKQLYVAFHDHVEAQRVPDGALYPVREFAAKAAEHALRMAGVLMLVDNADAQVVSADIMGRAITLAGYYLQEALRLEGVAAANPDLVDAEKLLEWLTGWQENHPQWSVGDVVRYGPNALRETDRIRFLLAILQRHGLARCVKQRPERWEARKP